VGVRSPTKIHVGAFDTPKTLVYPDLLWSSQRSPRFCSWLQRVGPEKGIKGGSRERGGWERKRDGNGCREELKEVGRERRGEKKKGQRREDIPNF